VLDAADHLLDPAAAAGERRRGADGAVAARPPAADHDGQGRVELRDGPVRDPGRRQVPGPRDAACARAAVLRESSRATPPLAREM
jgi:hypothetical protein